MNRFEAGVGAAALALTVLSASACTAPIPDESAEISELSNAWVAALNEGDVDALVAMYADDARVMPPNGDTQQGGEAVRTSFGSMIDAGLAMGLETLEAAALGDIGYHVGTYRVLSDGAEIDQGKFVETWRKTAEGWRISNDIWNSDLPPAAADTTTLSIVHEVKDAARWLAAWRGEDSRRSEFARHGVAAVRTFQSREQPNLTGLVVDISDMEAFQSFMASSEVAAAKRADGVIDRTLRVLVEVE